VVTSALVRQIAFLLIDSGQRQLSSRLMSEAHHHTTTVLARNR